MRQGLLRVSGYSWCSTRSRCLQDFSLYRYIY